MWLGGRVGLPPAACGQYRLLDAKVAAGEVEVNRGGGEGEGGVRPGVVVNSLQFPGLQVAPKFVGQYF